MSSKNVLLKSNFFDRLIGYSEKFDMLFHKDATGEVKKWINNEEYEYIRYFLLFDARDSAALPFTLKELSYMSDIEFEGYRKYAQEVCALQDEGKTLYEELLKSNTDENNML